MEESHALQALAALAQPTRLRAFKALVQAAPDGVAAGDLARSVGAPQNTLSAHLTILAQAGLVESERHGRSIVYRASLDQFRAIMVYLLKDCCGGRAEICAPLLADLSLCRDGACS